MSSICSAYPSVEFHCALNLAVYTLLQPVPSFTWGVKRPERGAGADHPPPRAGFRIDWSPIPSQGDLAVL